MSNSRARPMGRRAPVARRVLPRSEINLGGGQSEEQSAQRSLAEHVQWCREERERLLVEMARFEAGSESIGTHKRGEALTLGSITRIAFLRRSVEQLGRVIAACDLSDDCGNTADYFDPDRPEEIQ